MTLGQTFGAYASSMKEELKLINEVSKKLLILNMGATAIGTGICSEPGYCGLVLENLRKNTGLDISISEDLILLPVIPVLWFIIQEHSKVWAWN